MDDQLVYQLMPSLAFNPNTRKVPINLHRDYALNGITEIGFIHPVGPRYLRSDVLKMRKRIRSFRQRIDRGEPGAAAAFEVFRSDTSERVRNVMRVIGSFTLQSDCNLTEPSMPYYATTG